MIDFDEILKDLELKRAAARPAAEHMAFDVHAALDGLGGEPDVAVGGPGGPVPFRSESAAVMVADALATIALARGGDDPLVLAAPGIIRDAVRDVRGRLADLEAGAAITAEDLSSLVEAALIRGGRHEVATALVMRRATPPEAGGSVAGPRVIRRSGHIVDWRESKIEVAIRKAFLSGGADPARRPPSRRGSVSAPRRSAPPTSPSRPSRTSCRRSW